MMLNRNKPAVRRPPRDISVQYVKGVGPSRAKTLAGLGVSSVEDLFYLFPRRYEDRRRMAPLNSLQPGETATVCGRVLNHQGRRSWFTHKHVTEVVIADDTGYLTAVWFNQPYLDRYLIPGRSVVLFGKVEVYKGRLQMVAPEYEVLELNERETNQLNIGRIVPVYPLTRGITQRYLRKIIHNALQQYGADMVDTLPVALRNRLRLYNIRRALWNIHFPENEEAQQEAARRLSFEEFFIFQTALMQRRLNIVLQEGVAHELPAGFIADFERLFDFSFTPAQRRAIHELAQDMQRPHPMLRLLQGDVGSGKTVVAFFGCVAAWASGHQAAVMAPTEILAQQHYHKLQALIERCRDRWGEVFGKPPLRAAFLSGQLKAAQRRSLLEDLSLGRVSVVVGTHALLQEEVVFKDLSFVVIDEQHKFGVQQRALLSQKGNHPDVLLMTATPIPRTLSLTLFGDLDVSVLDEMPPGRGRVTTVLLDESEADKAYERVREQVEQFGRQSYIVYPLVNESDKLELKAVLQMHRRLERGPLKGLRLGIVHGKMPKTQAQAVMDAFRRGEIQVLLATTVVEVGVDVPEANCILIEHAERFGLAQLHQLRGRIGRGGEDGLCLLVAQINTDEARRRLEVMVETTDGFKIAEADLAIRGPGRYFGKAQHGMGELRFANPAVELDLLKQAREEAKAICHDDPRLSEPAHALLKQEIIRRYPTYLEGIQAG